MKLLGIALGLAATATLLILWSDPVEATTVCQGGSGPANADVCQGYAHVTTTTGGVASARCFALRITNTAPTCSTSGITPSNEGTWQLNAGACITFYYFNVVSGGVPPATPNKIGLMVREDSSATNVIVYKDGTVAPDASGTSYSFCATSTGLVGDAARAGTYRLFLNPIKDNGAGGIGNYNINTDGGGSPVNFDRGALRGRIVVSDISRSAYPAGSTFAYGTAGDESITITASFTTPNTEATVETMRNGILDEATLLVGQVGSTVDVDTGSLAQSFVVDQTFPMGNSPYVGIMELVGNSVLTGLKWTIMATTGHGATIVTVSDTFAYNSADFNIDPRIAMDSDGAGTFATADNTDVTKLTSSAGALVELFNRGEVVYHEWYIFNARSEKLSRSMTFRVDDSDDALCVSYGSLGSAANKYSRTQGIPSGGTCTAPSDTIGDAKHVDITNTDQAYDSGTVFFVSSLLRFDTDGSGAPDGDILTCLTTCPATEITVYNRGEIVDFNGYLINARGTQYQETGVQWRAEDSLGTQTNSQSISHSSGRYNGAAFTLGSSEKATADTVGDPHRWTATKNGNTATSVTPIFGVSSLYFIDSHTQINAVLSPDNFPTENANEDFNFTIKDDGMGGDDSDTIHLWCHVVGVRKDVNIDTGVSSVARVIYDPFGTLRINDNTGTGADGWTPTSLDLLSSTPLGRWTALCNVSNFSGNAGSYTQNITVMVNGTAGGGDIFTGDPLKLFTSPIVANPGESILVVVSESFLDGTARTGNANGTFIDVYDGDGALVVSNANPTEVGLGTYIYEFDVNTTAPGNWFVLVNTTDPSSGDPVGTSNTFFLETDGNVDPVTNFETATSTSGLEFVALIAVVIVAILIWSRSTDYLVQIGMGVLCLIPAIIWLRLAILSNGPTVASLNAMLALFAGVVGGYLIIRTGLDQFGKKEGI